MKARFIPVFLLLLSTPFLMAQSNQTIKVETPSFEAGGLANVKLETASGSLTVIGDPGTSNIEVRAEWRTNASNDSDVQRVLDNLVMTTDLRGDTFYLKTEQKNNWGWNISSQIDLTIKLPANLTLDIDDGSGYIEVSGMYNAVEIEDGSGEIRLDGVEGSITIEDGSGAIKINDAGSHVEISDGSGEIDIQRAGGNVRIRDGSGSIDVSEVGGDFIVSNDGSGSIHYSKVSGTVDIPRKK